MGGESEGRVTGSVASEPPESRLYTTVVHFGFVSFRFVSFHDAISHFLINRILFTFHRITTHSHVPTHLHHLDTTLHYVHTLAPVIIIPHSTMTQSKYHALVKSLTKKQILSIFPGVTPLEETKFEFSSSSSSSSDSTLFSGHDEEQIKLMDENCIVLNYNDEPIGAGTKKLCHIMENIDKGLLHRAFSVFLFNSENKLLLQQRADEKITFAQMWTNTCCSHPLCIKSEYGLDSKTNQFELDLAIEGAKNAAQRKLDQELGIQIEDIPFEDFKFLTRIHYMSPSNDIWGEHEIDYILIIKADPKININPNEVKDYKYVDADELKEMFNDQSLVFTPWFKLICENYLFKWWDNLDDLEQFKNTEIDRML